MTLDRSRLLREGREIGVRLEQLSNHALAEADMTCVQARVMLYIMQHAGQGTTVTALHRDTGYSKATISGLIKRLREEGYVRTEPCQADDRCKLLFSTRKSLEMQEFLQACAGRSEDVLYRDFSPEELASLDRLQQKMLCNLSAFRSHTQKEV